MTGPSIALDLLARACVVLAAAGLAHALLRRASASVRAGIWTIALTSLLMLPVLSRVLPSWRIEVLKPIAQVQESKGPTAQGSEGPRVQESKGPQTPEHNGPIVQGSNGPSGREAARVLGDTETAPTPQAATFPWWPIFAAWIAIAAILLARVLASHIRLTLIARRPASSDDAELDAEIQRARVRLAITRAVTWRTTDDVSVPAVSGFTRATLLLPADASLWPPAVKRSVVAHELAHVARWDAAGHLIGQLACAAYWFVPFVWLGARRGTMLREQACDDAALQSGVMASTYASTLILLAEQAGVAPTAAALPMASPSHIQERVMAILDPSVRRRAITVRAAVALLFASAGVVVLAATVEPAHRVTTAGPAETDTTLVAAPATTAPVARVEVASSKATGQSRQAPSRPTPPQAASRLCGDEPDSSSSSIHEDDGKRTWTIKLKGARCTVDFRLDGKVEFNDEFTDIASISSGGFMRLDVTDNGVRHELELKPTGSSLQRTWRVDGKEKPYDDEAKAWFASFLIEIDRRTAVGVDHRLPRLLRAGGVNAVLEETGNMRSDYVRGVYYQKLAGATKLSAGDITRIIQQATSLKTSDFYATEMVKGFVKASGDDAAARAAMLQLIATMESDFYITESAKAVAGRAPITSREADLLADLLPRIKSDFYKSEFIRSLVGGSDAGGAHSKTIVDAASGIKDDFYLSETFAMLTAKLSLTEADLLAMVDRARRISSDFYAAETLRRLAAHKSATARVRQAVTDAAQRLSSFYRDQVVRAAGGKGSA